MPSQVTKAVIPVAGLGTRFLPFTKSVPKALLPILDTPVIELIVREAIEAGITEIFLVTSPGQSAIEGHFESAKILELALKERGKNDLLAKLQPFHEQAKIIAVRQTEPLGLGHAILMSEELVKNEPFVVLLGDDLFLGNPSPIQQLIETYMVKNSSVVAVQKVPREQVVHYGVADVEAAEGHTFKVKGFVEKPSVEEAPSELILPGRYLFTPDIFSHLHEIKPANGGEYQLTDALKLLAKSSDMYAQEVTSTRFDVGQVPGFINATLTFAWNRPELRATMQKWFSENINQ